jgi:hypothetical protein
MAQEQLDLSVGALRAVRLSTREPNQVGERGLRLLIELCPISTSHSTQRERVGQRPFGVYSPT